MIANRICVLALAVCLVVSGCAGLQKSGAAAVDCLESKVASQALLALPLVLAVIQHKDWEAELAKLAGKVAPEVLACALSSIHLAVPDLRATTRKAALRTSYRGLP